MRLHLIWIVLFGIPALVGGVLQADGLPGAAAEEVLLVRLEDEPITPVTARFLDRAIREAASAQAQVLVIEMDTPGGLMTSTRQIVKAILASPVPVVIYVAPSGARAASAGVFLTMAAHVAAMAPGTHIGAAHPVQIGGAPAEPAGADSARARGQQPSVMEEKVVNDAVAWVRSLAELRGRNAEWAALAVSESQSITATEALERNVVDLLAADLQGLLLALDGQVVALGGGERALRTAGAPVRTFEMWWGEEVLGLLSNPNVAFLLLMFGFYGILFEFYTPGWGVAGTLGAICLMLGFFGMSILPINYAGLVLIVLALGLFVAEAFVTSFGALTLGGVVCLVLGGIMLVDAPFGFLRVSTAVLIPAALATALISFFLVSRVVKTHRGRVQTGSESMLGMRGVASEAFASAGGVYGGMVQIRGEWWRAESPVPIAAGDVVEVTDRQGLTLVVAVAARQHEDAASEKDAASKNSDRRSMSPL